MPAPHKLAFCLLLPLIDMWGQSLVACHTTQQARRIEVRATLTTASSSNTPSPNKTPRKKTRSSGYGPARPFPLDIPALQQNYGWRLFPGRPPMLRQWWMPPQWDEQLCVDNFSTVAIHTANKVSPECDCGQGSENAWYSEWLDHLLLYVRWMGVSVTCTTCVRWSGRVPALFGRHMAAKSCALAFILLSLICLRWQWLWWRRWQLPFLLSVETTSMIVKLSSCWTQTRVSSRCIDRVWWTQGWVKNS